MYFIFFNPFVEIQVNLAIEVVVNIHIYWVIKSINK